LLHRLALPKIARCFFAFAAMKIYGFKAIASFAVVDRHEPLYWGMFRPQILE